jgi:hypothetical protein
MRTIREEPEYQQAIEYFGISYRRLDEALGEMSARIRSHPEKFPSAPGWRTHRIKLVDYPGVPNLSIFFTYDDQMVYLLDAVLGPEED